MDRIVYVGLDCGGSSTRARAENERGRLLGHAASGPANLVSTPIEHIREHVGTVAKGIPPATHVVGCFAGLVDADAEARATSLLRDFFPSAETVRSVPDFFAPTYTVDRETITVISGTGSLVAHRDGNNQVHKSGGRGYLLGDPGSGYRIGVASLNWALDHPDRLTEEDLSLIARQLGSRDASRWISIVHQPPVRPATLARLAPILGHAAGRFADARERLREVVTPLAHQVWEHAMRFRLPVTVAGFGGSWRNVPHAESEFRAILRGFDSSAEFSACGTPPVRGAVRLARESARVGGDR